MNLFLTSASALGHSIGNSSSWGINHRHDSNKTEICDWEVLGFFGLEFEIFGEFIFWQVVMAETQHTFT